MSGRTSRTRRRINGEDARLPLRAAPEPARSPARRAAAHRREGRLQQRQLRRLQRHPRRPARELLLRPRRRGRGRRGHDHRGRRRRARLHPLQQSFLEDAALQCGICTPGFIVAAKALLDREPDADEARSPPLARRQPLPLHRLRQDRPRRPRRRRHEMRSQRRRDEAVDRSNTMVTTDKPTTRSSAPGPSAPTASTRSPAAPSTAPTSTCRACSHGAHDAQPARPRHHQEHRHVEGAELARREGRRHRRRPRPRRRPVSEAAATAAQNILAGEKVLYRGHAVAAVAATTTTSRRRRVKLIEVEYEPLPAVLDVRDAMRPDAPILHEALRTAARRRRRTSPSNVAAHTAVRVRRRREGLRRGRRRRRARVHDEDGAPGLHRAARVDARSGTPTASSPSGPAPRARSPCARRQLGDPRPPDLEDQGRPDGDRRRLRRQDPHLPRARRRAPLEEDRPAGEDAHGPRRGLRGHRPDAGHVHQGEARRDEGRQAHRALQADLAYESGAFPGSAGDVRRRWRCRAATTSRTSRSTATTSSSTSRSTQDYRAPGAPARAFAIEQLVDELAEKLGIDPLEFRLENASKEGTRGPMGMPFKAHRPRRLPAGGDDHRRTTSRRSRARTGAAASPPASGSTSACAPA